MQILQCGYTNMTKNVQALLFCEERYLYVDFPVNVRGSYIAKVYNNLLFKKSEFVLSWCAFFGRRNNIRISHINHAYNLLSRLYSKRFAEFGSV